MNDDLVYDLEGVDWDDIHDRPRSAAYLRALMEDAAAEITRLRAELATARREVAGWQPIETAPKDGTVILVYRIDPCTDWQPIETAPKDGTWFVIINEDDPDSVEVGRYNPLELHRYYDAGNGLFRKVSYIRCKWDGFNNFHSATHWRPAFDKLPAPPEDHQP